MEKQEEHLKVRGGQMNSGNRVRLISLNSKSDSSLTWLPLDLILHLTMN